MRTLSGKSSPFLLVEHRLVIEEVMLRRPAAHEEVDDAFGFGREVWLIENALKGLTGAAAEAIASQQAAERHGHPSRAAKRLKKSRRFIWKLMCWQFMAGAEITIPVPLGTIEFWPRINTVWGIRVGIKNSRSGTTRMCRAATLQWPAYPCSSVSIRGFSF